MPALNLTSLKREEKEREGKREMPPHLEKYIQTKNNLQKKILKITVELPLKVGDNICCKTDEKMLLKMCMFCILFF